MSKYYSVEVKQGRKKQETIAQWYWYINEWSLPFKKQIAGGIKMFHVPITMPTYITGINNNMSNLYRGLLNTYHREILVCKRILCFNIHGTWMRQNQLPACVTSRLMSWSNHISWVVKSDWPFDRSVSKQLVLCFPHKITDLVY